MSTEVLMLALLASITAVAMMITLNTRGKWRATISAMMSACLFGGTVWLFTLQYSAIVKDDAQGERRRLSLRDLIPPGQNKTQHLSALLEEANNFATELENAQLRLPSYTREQLAARAGAAESGFEALLGEVSESKPVLENSPEAAKLVDEAMGELKGACHLFKAYYYAENTDGEITTERLMKQKAHSACSTLVKAIKIIKIYEK
jgi:hypothetical protein